MTQISLEHGLLHEPACDSSRDIPPRKLHFLSVAYPRLYVCVFVLAILDIVITTMVLGTGGKELNALARWAIEHAGLLGMVAIKATTLTIVLSICEYLGRRRPRTGLRIAGFALVANSAAVMCGVLYLAQYTIVILQWQ